MDTINLLGFPALTHTLGDLVLAAKFLGVGGQMFGLVPNNRKQEQKNQDPKRNQ